MIIRVRAQNVRLYLPLPVSLIGIALRLTPEKVLEDLRMETPEPYRGLVTKEYIGVIVRECMDVIKEYRGLEVIHVETEDGTYVSIRL